LPERTVLYKNEIGRKMNIPGPKLREKRPFPKGKNCGRSSRGEKLTPPGGRDSHKDSEGPEASTPLPSPF